ncbi:cysteine-rich receptor-like protein kinase 25 [Tasmannia lanceolata]|uniref:cysteine-rich receptor-like protein kinase 25 n=1 Tax=Tasmannia lanceolata TaxID=3420 RepID=UPI004062B653
MVQQIILGNNSQDSEKLKTSSRCSQLGEPRMCGEKQTRWLTSSQRERSQLKGIPYPLAFALKTSLVPFSVTVQANDAKNLSTFYSTTFGEDPDRVYGFSQCMSGASAQDCQECQKNASVEIIQLRPNRTQAIVRYYNCILRYSNQQFFSLLNDGIQIILWRVETTSDPVLFNQGLGDLMRNLTSTADACKYATRITRVGDFTSLYGLGQCTRDLSKGECQSCLDTMISYIPSCPNQTGGNVHSVSCNIRYDPYLFFPASPPPPESFAVPPPLSPPPPSETPRNKNGSRLVLIITIVVVSTFVLIFIICAWSWKRKPVKTISNDGVQEELSFSESLLFGLATLKAATDNLSDANKLGEGGFGPVYKSSILSYYRRIREDFLNHVAIFYRHKNLVRLLGFYLEENEKILVYEYLPNTSLDTSASLLKATPPMSLRGLETRSLSHGISLLRSMRLGIWLLLFGRCLSIRTDRAMILRMCLLRPG